MKPGELEQQIAGLAALDDPVRRSLYFYVAGQPGSVSRDEAAEAAGVSRNLAGFHLDRLHDEGLLDVSFQRLSGRSGPGAGRPSKLYRRSARQLAVSLPQRSYELAAHILAAAIGAGKGPQVRAALKTNARMVGKQMGLEARARAGSRPGRKRLIAGAREALAAGGYEPESGPGEICLRNCPFHALVTDHKEMICGMNLALIEGVVEGLDLQGAQPVLDPKPGRCCVTLRLGAK